MTMALILRARWTLAEVSQVGSTKTVQWMVSNYLTTTCLTLRKTTRTNSMTNSTNEHDISYHVGL